MAASVRQRLSKIAANRGVDFQQVLVSYAIERLLYRISVSPHAQSFILKGATLFTLWEGFPHRQTRDVDLLGFGENSVVQLEIVFTEILRTPVPDDGLIFGTVVRAETIRALQEYGGVRVHLTARLEKARIAVGVDVGFGDSIHPSPKMVDFPTLLDFPKPRVRAYPAETVIAEKLQAMVHLGLANSRMKVFFDLWHLGRGMNFDGPALGQAVQETFRRRETLIPEDTPLALTEAFAKNPMKVVQWNGFIRKTVGSRAPVELAAVVAFLNSFLGPILAQCRTCRSVLKKWPAGGPWTA